jgi:hypothetical protein
MIVKSGIELFNPAFFIKQDQPVLPVETQKLKKNKEELTLQDSNGQ